MTEQGKNVLGMIRGIQQLNSEIARFLEACDKLLHKREFRPDGNAVTKELSQSLKEPSGWVPLWFYRTYKNGNNPHEILCLNVALDNAEVPDDRFQEPLVICGLLNFSNAECYDCWDAWYLFFHAEPIKKETNRLYDLNELNLQGSELVKKCGWTNDDIESIKNCRLIATELMAIEESATAEKRLFEMLFNNRQPPSNDGHRKSNKSRINP